MKIDEVIWDEAVYPRSAVNRRTVDAYVEALSIGAQFPAVLVQRVVNYTPGRDLPATVIILIDGVHRWHAFRQAGRTDIPVIHYQDAVLDYEAVKTELLLESARNNTSHGDRLTPADKKRIARDIAASDPKCRYTETALAEKLGVIQQTVNAWITDIRARQKTNRDSIIIRLSRLVLDPMSGGGVVPDVCLAFERKCRAFDLAPSEGRPEIECHHWNPQNRTWPLDIKPDLIFFDPPYYTKKAKEYEQKAGKTATSISSFTKKAYEAFFTDFFSLAHENTNPGACLAFLNADWYDFESTPAAQEDPGRSITLFGYHRLMTQTGWKVIRRIECPLSTERLTGNQVQKMQDKRILGTIGRTLLIARRRNQGSGFCY